MRLTRQALPTGSAGTPPGDPTRFWQPREIAARFGDVTRETMYRQLNQWAASGLIHKLGPRPLRRNTMAPTPLDAAR